MNFVDSCNNLIFYDEKRRKGEIFSKWHGIIFQIPTKHLQITSRWYWKKTF